MAVGKIQHPDLKPLAGVRLSAVAAGIRYRDRDDLVIMELCEGTVVGGCFTQNRYRAAPVIIAKQHLDTAAPRYLLINSGNANACTGEQGRRDALACCDMVANNAAVNTQSVLPFSTGVIGEPLPMAAFESAIPLAMQQLSQDAWTAAANAIMTTDTFAKMVSCELQIAGKPVRINGMAKGAGMIRPDMATMLAYMVTDACVSQAVIQQVCAIATEKSFNRITVDGDTSTNDAAILAATQQAGNPLIDNLDSADGQLFLAQVIDLYQQLAQLLVRDGEGATKFVTIQVKAGRSTADCLQVAYTLAHSPLVKTAIFAGDPNWGRIVAAIGRADVPDLDADKIRIWINDTQIVANGGVAAGYTEQQGQALFNLDEFSIAIDLAMGDSEETIWTCDLSHEYVSINADYRS